MPTRPWKAAACLLALLLASAGAARSQAAQAGVLILNLNYELFDLDLRDGIAPSLSYSAPTAVLNVKEYPFTLAHPPLRDRSATDFGINEIYGDNGGAFAGANPYAQRSAAHAFYGAYSAQTSVIRGFTLTPHTRVVFSAEAELHVRSSAEGDSLARARLDGQLFGPDDGPVDFGAQYQQWDTGGANLMLLAGGFSGDEAAYGTVALHSYAHAAGLPVPEPSSWTALLAGLALLAGTVWRRRRKTVASVYS